MTKTLRIHRSFRSILLYDDQNPFKSSFVHRICSRIEWVMFKKNNTKESEKKMKVKIAIDEVVYEFAKTTFQLVKKYDRLKRLNKVSN